MEKINLLEKFSRFTDHWSPKIAGELNGQHVKLVKFKGEFVWHHHEAEDELFLVVRGNFRMEFRDKSVELNEGEFIIVPKGIEHKPVADDEVWVLLFEPASTLNTGNVVDEKTKNLITQISQLNKVGMSFRRFDDSSKESFGFVDKFLGEEKEFEDHLIIGFTFFFFFKS